MENLIVYLETRIEALDNLIAIHRSQTGDYLVMERAVCMLQLDQVKQRLRQQRLPMTHDETGEIPD